MDTKFTKGKWLLTEEPKSKGMCSTSTGHFHIETDEVHKFIKIENEHREESKANAHLIAVAPDMYAMIKELAHELNLAIDECNEYRAKSITPLTESEPDYIDKQTVHEAQALLAKARGE